MKHRCCLPVLIMREHFMPQRVALLQGQGPMFTNSLRAAQRAGGMWLAHQDSCGYSAMQQDDLVCFATITQLDWLSQPQIVAHCEIHYWAKVADPKPGATEQWACPSLYAKPIKVWPKPSQAPHQLHLQQALTVISQQHPELTVEPCSSKQAADAQALLCWRWLELLPLPLKTKQRLLRAPSAKLCLRYLNFILRQNDRFNHLSR